MNKMNLTWIACVIALSACAEDRTLGLNIVPHTIDRSVDVCPGSAVTFSIKKGESKFFKVIHPVDSNDSIRLNTAGSGNVNLRCFNQTGYLTPIAAQIFENVSNPQCDSGGNTNKIPHFFVVDGLADGTFTVCAYQT
ncbi:MAG: hypothetical protein JNL01_07965 [Bdellovibrionales bacterium]|nr:hypothetical protein [Bdellovibrionales bacterium]